MHSIIQRQVVASVTSSTHERKSKTNIGHKNGKIYLRHNAFTCAREGGGEAAAVGMREQACAPCKLPRLSHRTETRGTL